MSELIEIGRNVVLLRNAQGLTQEEVAFRSNRSVSCLQSIECGFVNPTVDTLILVAKALNIDSRVMSIFTRSDNAILTEIREGPQLPKRSGNILQICDNICLFRKELGLSQKELAHISGISATRLRDIEHGCANTTANKLLLIANAFNISLTKLNHLATREDELMDLIHNARAMAGINKYL